MRSTRTVRPQGANLSRILIKATALVAALTAPLSTSAKNAAILTALNAVAHTERLLAVFPVASQCFRSQSIN